MTPEEKAVVDAAEGWFLKTGFDAPEAQAALAVAVTNLREARRQEPAEITKKWYPATWGDVRAGDHIRLLAYPDHPRRVYAVSKKLAWHVDPRSGKYDATPMEWATVNVMFSDGETLPFVTTNPVEIELPVIEYDAIMTLGGWANRV